MRHIRFFLLLSVLAPAAWAQPWVSRNGGERQSAPEQRRAELRLVLQAPRKEPEPEATAPGNRRLSEQERADLRQQLRQQRRTGQPDRR
jgi:hypothetical protein